MPNPFYDLLSHYAQTKKQDKLLQVGDESISYGELLERTKKIAKGLYALQISENSKIGIILPNSISWYEIFWSSISLGAQPVPMDPQSGEWELESLLQMADIEVCFVAHHYKGNSILEHMLNIYKACPKLKKVIVLEENMDDGDMFITMNQLEQMGQEIESLPVPKYDKNKIMSLACTSGTTGNPKILAIPEQGFYEAIVDMSNYLEINKEDRMLIGMPLYHQGGFGMGLQTVVKGGMVIYEPQFNPYEFIRIVKEEKITIIQLTATLAKILLSTKEIVKEDFKTVRYCYFAGEVLPREIASLLVEQLHIRVINVIGSSETATMTVWDSDKDYEVDPSDFHALPFTSIRVIDEKGEEVKCGEVGELSIYTTAVIVGYYNNDQLSKEKIETREGKRWFHTGDLVQRLDTDRIRFVGRKKRIIKRGANLIYAEEVEAFLLSHPKIAAVAVKAVPDELIGEKMIAYVQTVAGESLTRGDLLKFYKGKMSNYKVPDQVVLVDEVPHDIGKVQHKYVRGE